MPIDLAEILSRLGYQDLSHCPRPGVVLGNDSPLFQTPKEVGLLPRGDLPASPILIGKHPLSRIGPIGEHVSPVPSRGDKDEFVLEYDTVGIAKIDPFDHERCLRQKRV